MTNIKALRTLASRHTINDNRLMLGLRTWGIDYSDGKGVNAAALDMTFYGFMVGYDFN